MNSVQLIGRLTRDPELRSVAGVKELCRMRVAVPRPDSEAQPVYVDVVCFDGQASACADHLAKGHRIGIEGRLDYSEWEVEDGSKRSRHEVVARRVNFLDTPQGNQAAVEAGSDAARVTHSSPARAKDAIPF